MTEGNIDQVNEEDLVVDDLSQEERNSVSSESPMAQNNSSNTKKASPNLKKES